MSHVPSPIVPIAVLDYRSFIARMAAYKAIESEKTEFF